MLNYNIVESNKKSDSATLWLGLTGSGGRRCVYTGERNPPALSFFHAPTIFFFFFPNHSLPGGLTGRWKRLYRNNKPWEETMRETTRWQNGRRGRKWDPMRAHGPAHVSIMPTDQRLCLFPSPWWLRPTSDQEESNQDYDSVLKTYFLFFCCRCTIFDISPIEPDWACKSVILWGLILKDEISFKITSLWQVLYLYFSSMVWSCPGSSLVPRPVSPQSRCV